MWREKNVLERKLCEWRDGDGEEGGGDGGGEGGGGVGVEGRGWRSQRESPESHFTPRRCNTLPPCLPDAGCRVSVVAVCTSVAMFSS